MKSPRNGEETSTAKSVLFRRIPVLLFESNGGDVADGWMEPLRAVLSHRQVVSSQPRRAPAVNSLNQRELEYPHRKEVLAYNLIATVSG